MTETDTEHEAFLNAFVSSILNGEFNGYFASRVRITSELEEIVSQPIEVRKSMQVQLRIPTVTDAGTAKVMSGTANSGDFRINFATSLTSSGQHLHGLSVVFQVKGTDYSIHDLRPPALPLLQASPTVRAPLTPLTLFVDPGTAAPEKIAELLSEISRLYEMVGGTGITFTNSGIAFPEAAQ